MWRPDGTLVGAGPIDTSYRLYGAALSPDLKPGRMESREYLGQPVMIGRTKAGAVYALRDVCPHRAAPLSAGGWSMDTRIVTWGSSAGRNPTKLA